VLPRAAFALAGIVGCARGAQETALSSGRQEARAAGFRASHIS